MSYSNHVYGLIGCTTFALLGNYIAFFHSARLQVAHFLISSTTATILLIRTLTAGQAPAVVIIDIYLVMVISVFALSFNAQINIHYLSIDLDESEIDPLCGLLDRRGFQRHFDTMMLAARENTKPDLSVTMIDLDKFKSLNDSRGHAAGDKALHAVAAIISDLEQDGALSARIGGEEFIIAEFGHATHAVRRASTLCREIAALDCGITASVGVASVPAPSSTPSDSRAFVQSLIASADSAMYEAKRAGGDRVAQALTPGEI